MIRFAKPRADRAHFVLCAAVSFQARLFALSWGEILLRADREKGFAWCLEALWPLEHTHRHFHLIPDSLTFFARQMRHHLIESTK